MPLFAIHRFHCILVIREISSSNPYESTTGYRRRLYNQLCTRPLSVHTVVVVVISVNRNVACQCVLSVCSVLFNLLKMPNINEKPVYAQRTFLPNWKCHRNVYLGSFLESYRRFKVYTVDTTMCVMVTTTIVTRTVFCTRSVHLTKCLHDSSSVTSPSYLLL